MDMRNSTVPQKQQKGVALLMGLIFLVVLTLLSITAARMSSLEERMSGNLRDRSLAVQAAERALRDAEMDIRDSGRVTGLTNFDANCTNGLCYNGASGSVNGTNWNVTPVWSIADMTMAPSVEYGSQTASGAIAGVSSDPRYLIEGIRKNQSGGGQPAHFYRITVRAQGANPNTVVWMQELFRP
jgi:type IV pilus assembly protein PilX